MPKSAPTKTKSKSKSKPSATPEKKMPVAKVPKNEKPAKTEKSQSPEKTGKADKTPKPEKTNKAEGKTDKKSEKPASTATPPSTTTVVTTTTSKHPAESPYQLDTAQVHKAARALLKHVAVAKGEGKGSEGKRNLLEDEEDPSEDAQTVWLVVTTKKFVTESKRMKPVPIRLPTPLLNPSKIEVCLIVKDPQRHYKDLIASTPLSTTITKIIGISKLAKKFKSFEERRRLEGSYDMFLADDRVIPKLPEILGKAFLKKTAKIPIPVSLVKKEKAEAVKAELEKALESTYLWPKPAPSVSVRVALSTFTPEQVVGNVEATVKKVVGEKKVQNGWRGVRSLHIKTSESAALPIWMASTIYDQEDVLLPEEEKRRQLVQAEKAVERKEKKEKLARKKKRKAESAGGEGEVLGETAKRQKVAEV